MAKIVYRGAYATFPMVGNIGGDLAYATDYLLLYEWSGTAWVIYSDYPDYEGGKSKLFTAADWAALEATDVNFAVTGNNIAFNTTVQTVYVVPAGRTLYISHVAFQIYADLIASGDLNQMGRVALSDTTAGVVPVSAGGNGGGSMALVKPMVIPAGHTFSLSVTSHANHNVDVDGTCSGYQV